MYKVTQPLNSVLMSMNALSTSAITVPFTYRDIQWSATSQADVWKRIRAWSEIQTTGNSHLTYDHVKNSFNHNTISYSDFYLKLLNDKEDLLSVTGNVSFEGAQYVTDGKLTPLLQSDVVLDWMHTIWGPALVKHIFCIFAEDLATNTPHDIRQRIINNINTIILEAENTSKASQFEVGRAEINSLPAYSKPVSVNRVNINKRGAFQQNHRAANRPQFSRPFNPCQPAIPPPSAPCTYCHPPQDNTHTILTCFKLEHDKKALSINSATIIDYNDDETNRY